MSKIKWDQDGQRLYETGIDHGVLFKASASQSATNKYEKGVAWNGLTSIDESPDGAEANDLYADNIKYLSLMSAENFGGTINAYTYPDEFMDCDGTRQPVSGVIVSQQTRLGFGLYYRTKKGNDTVGDDYGYIHHFIYSAKASPSDKTYETINDSPEAIEFSWEFTTTPVVLTSKDSRGNIYKPTSVLKIDTTMLDSDQLDYLDTLLDFVTGRDAATGDSTVTALDPTLPTIDSIIDFMKSGDETVLKAA